MQNRTWNAAIAATEHHPGATLEAVPQANATKLLRGLIYSPGTRDYAHVEHAVRAARVDEGSLAA